MKQLVMESAGDRRSRRISLVIWLCWLGVFSEGYALGVLGAVLPGMMKDPLWNLTAVEAGAIASSAVAGMFVGGLAIGSVSDNWGRRRCFIGCLAVLSLATAGAALAHDLALFALLRFVSGIGVGGIIPVAAALTTEFAAPESRNRDFAIMYSGYSLGILVAALTSFFLLTGLGWRAVMGIGGLPALALPLVAVAMPESVAYLAARGEHERASAIARRFGVAIPESIVVRAPHRGIVTAVLGLFEPAFVRATIGFALTFIASMILVYGLNTWLPQIMRSAGYDLGPSILFLGVFALSSAAGGIVLGGISDVAGRRNTIAGAFLLGVIAILLLSHPMAQPLTYLVVAMAGVGTVSAAVLLTSYVSAYYPPHMKATAVGFCGSVSRAGAVAGPMLGSVVAAWSLPIVWNFIIFAAAGLASAACMFIVPGDAPRQSRDVPALGTR